MTFLLDLLSAVLTAVALRHLATKPSSYFACFIFILLFSRAVAIAVSPLLFLLLGLLCHSLLLSAIFNSSCHFHRCRPFYRYRPFYHCSTSNIAAFHSSLDLELPFLLWSCRRHIHFAAKDFVVTTSRRPVFAFLVVVLLVIFTPSCCSYCHCSTGSISHTAILISLHPTLHAALFSVPIKLREHAYQSFMVVYGTGKVQQLCCYSTGAVKV